jgi:tRNA(adenine34) deaminase
VRLALRAEEEGNLPVGAVVTLAGRPIAEGASRVRVPAFHPARHAEIEALGRVPVELWPRAAEMTCYTTLEPCLMCLGALILHGVGRVVYGARDPRGGAVGMLAHLPDYVAAKAGAMAWIGPALPAVCDPLCARVLRGFEELP